jgi:hypothetical protein
MTRLTTAQIAPVRAKLLGQQKYICPLCQGSMKGGKKKPALDHDHQTGLIRDVLCLNCNGMEGKIFNLARRCDKRRFLQNLMDYWNKHTDPQHGGLFHPTHKTPEEKRLAANAKARKKRAALKG